MLIEVGIEEEIEIEIEIEIYEGRSISTGLTKILSLGSYFLILQQVQHSVSILVCNN